MLTKLFKATTSQRTNFSPHDQQRTARLLRRLIPCLLVLCSPEGALATPDLRKEIVPVVSTLPPLPPEGTFQSHPDSPNPPYNNNVSTTPSTKCAPQPQMSQEAAPDKGSNPPSTSPKVTSVTDNFPFQARGGERVRFYFHKGQWYAQVFARLGACYRQADLLLSAARAKMWQVA